VVDYLQFEQDEWRFLGLAESSSKAILGVGVEFLQSPYVPDTLCGLFLALAELLAARLDPGPLCFGNGNTL
jgi:hypothetical protein